MSGVNEIRSAFLDYFKKNGHEVVPSSPLVPRNDPTLMFTNAGMVQFKNGFRGLESGPDNTAATAQKCVRAGGKHNDRDNVREFLKANPDIAQQIETSVRGAKAVIEEELLVGGPNPDEDE